MCPLTSMYAKCCYKDKTKKSVRSVAHTCETFLCEFSLVSYHGLDDAVDGFRVNESSALRQVHCHEVPPENGRRWVGYLLQPRFIHVPGRSHHKHLDALVTGPLCCHLDAPTRVSSHMSVGYNHGESESGGGWGCAQHFLSHVGEGAVDVGTLAQVNDSIDTLLTGRKSVICFGNVIIYSSKQTSFF